jgi:DNA-binding transcriptional LysR family regulator
MEIEKLKHFCTTYKEKSLTRASLTLGLSKAALSLSLKSLEKNLQLTLFTRSNKNMLPTAEGHMLFERVSSILLELDEVKQQILESKVEYSGIIRIGAPVCFGSDVLMKFIRSYREKIPKAQIQITLGNGDEIMRLLEPGEIDFCIIGDDIRKKILGSMACEKIFEYQLVLCCSKKFFDRNLKGKRFHSPQIFKDLPLISLKNVPVKSWFDWHFKDSRGLKEHLIINNHHAHIEELLSSGGIGLQAKYSVESHLASGKLVNIRLPNSKDLKYTFYGVQHYNQVPSTVLKKLISHFKDHLSSNFTSS